MIDRLRETLHRWGSFFRRAQLERDLDAQDSTFPIPTTNYGFLSLSAQRNAKIAGATTWKSLRA